MTTDHRTVVHGSSSSSFRGPRLPRWKIARGASRALARMTGPLLGGLVLCGCAEDSLKRHESSSAGAAGTAGEIEVGGSTSSEQSGGATSNGAAGSAGSEIVGYAGAQSPASSGGSASGGQPSGGAAALGGTGGMAEAGSGGQASPGGAASGGSPGGGGETDTAGGFGGDGGSTTTLACTPGRQVSCPCLDAEQGVQRCLADGSGFSACVCGSCAGFEVVAELSPVYLVFMVDSSGSMGDSILPDGTPMWENGALRWDPLVAGLTEFFSNPGSPSAYASLEYFPAPGDLEATCSANYASPSVPLTPLSAPEALVGSMAAHSTSGGTPTVPALRGAVLYAQELQAENPHAHVAVVLITDGEPGVVGSDGQLEPACPAGDVLPNTVEGAAAVAQASYEGAHSISVHLLGIGDSVDGLSAIASAGGTELVSFPAIDPAAFSDQIVSTLRSIVAAQFSCDIAIPDPPSGETFVKEQLNLKFVFTSGTTETVLKSADCAGGLGWRYDNEEDPTTIQLCTSTCNAVVNSAPSIRLEFGCLTQVR